MIMPSVRQSETRRAIAKRSIAAGERHERESSDSTPRTRDDQGPGVYRAWTR